MDEQIEDIFPMDKEDRDLASFTSRLRRRTPNGSNRHKSRPISYPPCFSFDLPQPSFLKSRLLDRKPQKLIDPIPKEIALKAGRKVKFADEAGKPLVSYLEIPNKFDRFGFRSLTNISSVFDNAMEDTFESDSFDDAFETVDDIFDDVFNTSFDKPIFNIDNDSSEKSNSPGQKRKYGLKGQTFPKESCPKDMLFSEQTRMSDSTSRKKQINELSSPHVKLRKYSLEEWIITESDEENNCDILSKPTTFHKHETKKDTIIQPFQHKQLDSRKSHSVLEHSDKNKQCDIINKKSMSILATEEKKFNSNNTSYQDDDHDLPQTNAENKWINIPVVILNENKENDNPRSKVTNKNPPPSSDLDLPNSDVPVIDETEIKYKELCRKLYSAGQNKTSADSTILNTEEAIKDTQRTFTSQEVVEEVNFTLVINDLNNKHDAHDKDENSIDISYTYCPVISAVDSRKEAIKESESVMSSSFEENPNISFTIIAPSKSNPENNSDIVSQAEQLSKETDSDLLNQGDYKDISFSKGEAVQNTHENDFLTTTESAIQDILNIFDTVTFPEEKNYKKVDERDNCSKSSSKSSLEYSLSEESAVPNINNDNEDLNDSVELFTSANGSDNSNILNDIITPCIQVSKDSSVTDFCQNDFISGNEGHTSKDDDNHIDSQTTNETDNHLLCVDYNKTEISDVHHNISHNETDKHLLCVGDNMSEINDDMHSIYHESESGYVTYSHQDSMETMKDFDFDEGNDNSSYSYDTSSTETDIEIKCDTDLTAKRQLPQNVGIHSFDKNTCDSDVTYNSELKTKMPNTSKNLIDGEENNIHPVEKNNLSSLEGSYSDSCSESKETSLDEISEQNYSVKTKTFDGKETNVFSCKNSNIDNDESSTNSSKYEDGKSSSSDDSSSNNNNIISKNNEIFNQDSSCVSSLSSKTNSLADIYKLGASCLKNSDNEDKYSADSFVMSQVIDDKKLPQCNTIATDSFSISSHEHIPSACNDISAGNNTVFNKKLDKNNDILEKISDTNKNMCVELEPCDKQITYQDKIQLLSVSSDAQLETLSFSVREKEDNLLKTSYLHNNTLNNHEMGKIPYIHAIVQTNDVEHINIKIECDSKKYSIEQRFSRNNSFETEQENSKCKYDQVSRTLHGSSKNIPPKDETQITNVTCNSLPMLNKSNAIEDLKVHEKLNAKISQESKSNCTKNRHKHKLSRSNTCSSSDSENSDASVQYKKHKRTKRTKKSLKLSKERSILNAFDNIKDSAQGKLPLSDCILEEDLGNESDVESIFNDSNIGDSLTSSSGSLQGELCLSKDILTCTMTSIIPPCADNILYITGAGEGENIYENILTSGDEQQTVLNEDTLNSCAEEDICNIVSDENQLLQSELLENNKSVSKNKQPNVSISDRSKTESSGSSDDQLSGTGFNDLILRDSPKTVSSTSLDISDPDCNDNKSKSDIGSTNGISLRKPVCNDSKQIKTNKIISDISDTGSENRGEHSSVDDADDDDEDKPTIHAIARCSNSNYSSKGLQEDCVKINETSGTNKHKISVEKVIIDQNYSQSTTNDEQLNFSDNRLVSNNSIATYNAGKTNIASKNELADVNKKKISDTGYKISSTTKGILVPGNENDVKSELDSSTTSEETTNVKNGYGDIGSSKTPSNKLHSKEDSCHITDTGNDKVKSDKHYKVESLEEFLDKLINDKSHTAVSKISYDSKDKNKKASHTNCQSHRFNANNHDDSRDITKSTEDDTSCRSGIKDEALKNKVSSCEKLRSEETIIDEKSEKQENNSESECSSSNTSDDTVDDTSDVKQYDQLQVELSQKDPQLPIKLTAKSSDRRELVKSLSLSNSSESDKEIFDSLGSRCGSKIDDVSVTVTITCDGQLIVKDDTCDAFRN